MTHLIVFGTSHTLQCGHSSLPAASVQSFEDEVRRVIAIHSPTRIAEEMNSDGLVRHAVTETVAQRVAREVGIEHQHVDLTQADRVMLGLGDGPLSTILHLYNPTDGGEGFRNGISELEGEIRERVWAFRILNLLSSPVLFICGSLHVGPFVRLWRLQGLKCEVAHFEYSI